MMKFDRRERRVFLLLLPILFLLLLLVSCHKNGASEQQPEEKTDLLTGVFIRCTYTDEDLMIAGTTVPYYDPDAKTLHCFAYDPVTPDTGRIIQLRLGEGVVKTTDVPLTDGQYFRGAIRDNLFYYFTIRDGDRRSCCLSVFDADTGMTRTSEDLSPLYQNGTVEGILALAVDAEGNTWLAAPNEILVLDSDFLRINTLNGSANGFFPAPDGTVWSPTSDGVQIWKKDSKKAARTISLSERVFAVFFPDGYLFGYASADGLYGVTETEEGFARTILMDYANSDVAAKNVSLWGMTEDGDFLFYEDADRNSRPDSRPVLYKQGNDITLDEIVTLEIADVFGADQYMETRLLKNSIVAFNQDHADARLILKDYTEYNTKENPDGGIRKLMIEMQNGLYEPDLILMSPQDEVVLTMLNSGLLTDLSPFLDTDDTVNRDNVIGAVQRYFATENGGMWGITSCFSFQTLLSTEEMLGSYAGRGEFGWTLAEYLDFAENLPEDVFLQDSLTRASFSSNSWREVLGVFLDQKTGVCSFDSPLFVRFLNFISSLPQDRTEYVNISQLGQADGIERYDYFYNNHVALTDFSMATVNGLSRLETTFGTKNWAMIGYPAQGRNSTPITARHCYLMTSFCKDPSLAWDWICQEMDQEFTKTLPVRKDLLREALMEETKVDHVLVFSTGIEKGTAEDLNEPGYVCRLGEDDVERLIELMDTIAGMPRIDMVPKEVSDIVLEETSAYYAGVGTAEDCAKKIQSRVSIWLAEHQ